MCYPASSEEEENYNQRQFCHVASMVDEALGATQSDYFLESFSTADCIFTPYVERCGVYPRC